MQAEGKYIFAVSFWTTASAARLVSEMHAVMYATHDFVLLRANIIHLLTGYGCLLFASALLHGAALATASAAWHLYRLLERLASLTLFVAYAALLVPLAFGAVHWVLARLPVEDRGAVLALLLVGAVPLLLHVCTPIFERFNELSMDIRNAIARRRGY